MQRRAHPTHRRITNIVAAHHYAVRVSPHCLLSVGCFVGGDLMGMALWGYGVWPRHTIQRVFLMACCSRIPRATSTGIYIFYICVSWIRNAL